MSTKPSSIYEYSPTRPSSPCTPRDAPSSPPPRGGLATNTALQELDLSFNQITDVAELGRGLAANTALQTMDLSFNQITDVAELGRGLAANTALQKLDLSNTKITEASARELLAALAQRKTPLDVDLAGCGLPVELVVAFADTCTQKMMAIGQFVRLACGKVLVVNLNQGDLSGCSQ